MEKILLIHIFIIVLAVSLAQIGTRAKRKNISGSGANYAYFMSFLVLFFFIGFRVSLGTDWNNYEIIFNSEYQQNFSFGESREIGFLLLISFLKSLDLEFQSFIIVTSFFILLLFFFSYRKCYYLLPFGVFVFFMDWGYPVVINTIRQGIALMAVLNATLYIDSNEKHAGKKFLFYILLGFLFHYTILIFLPFYYVGKLKLSMVSLLSIIVIVFVLSQLIIIPTYEEAITLVDKYDHYMNNSAVYNEKSSFGLGAILVLLIRFAPLSIYTYVKKHHSNLQKYYVLYFIGLGLYYSFYQFLLITRVTFFFQFMELFVLAYFIYFLFVEKKQYRVIGVVYVFLMVFNYVFTFREFLTNHLVSNKCTLLFMDFYCRL